MSTRLNFASKSSKGKILRAVKNFNGPFITPLKCAWIVWRTLSPVLISKYPLNESFSLLQKHNQDFASPLLENFNCKVGVITLLSTLSQTFNNYVHFNERYSSKSLKDTENYY